MATLGTCTSVLLISWLIINYQVEQLVKKRTSEYAHSIARVAADSSAEALLSGDQLQLNLLVKNVAKDPYIRQATIFSEDGQVVSQFPQDLLTQAKPKPAAKDKSGKPITDSSRRAIDAYKSDFLQRQKNIPFIEKIVYQGVTGGWFKLEINSSLLEQDYRATFKQIQRLMASIALVLFLFLVIFVFKLKTQIDQLSRYCNKLLLQHNITPSKNVTAWVNALKHLSESQAQQLKEQVHLPHHSPQWAQSRFIDESLICLLEFDIVETETSDIAQQLSLAEKYLVQAAQSFGVQSQGDILSGSCIPFLDFYNGVDAQQNRLKDALIFITLIKRLFSHLERTIRIKATLAQAPLTLLEDHRELVTGLLVPQALTDKISRIRQQVDFEQTLILNLPLEKIKPIAKVKPLSIEGHQDNSYLLIEVTSNINALISRKQRHILEISQ